MSFYTYMWLRKKDGTPYYVGKASQLRRAYGNGQHSVNPPPKDRIVVYEWASEQEAFVAEMLLIVCYGRKDIGTGVLRNRTDGGEGSIGHKPSAETVAKIVAKNKGRMRSEEQRRTIRLSSLKGEQHPSYKARGASHWNRGLVRSTEAREKISQKRALQDMSYCLKTHCKRGHARTPDNLTANSTCRAYKKLLRP